MLHPANSAIVSRQFLVTVFPMELCETLQSNGSGYHHVGEQKADDNRHQKANVCEASLLVTHYDTRASYALYTAYQNKPRAIRSDQLTAAAM
jgi:hypothetical protein